MRYILKAIVAVAIVSAVCMVWSLVKFYQPYVRDFRGDTYDEFVAAAGEGFGLPRSARDIRFISSSVRFGGRARLIRFGAPVEDCQRFAIADAQKFAGRQDAAATPTLTPITVPPAMPTNLGAYGIHDVGWFDVANIKNGLTVKREHDQQPLTWIDTQRGVLYSVWTD